jgi:hypothetical protein
MSYPNQLRVGTFPRFVAIGFYFLSETLIYSTVQRENAKSVSFQGLSQCGINDVCIRGRSAKQHGHDGQNGL